MDYKIENLLQKSSSDAKHEQGYILSLFNGLAKLKEFLSRHRNPEEIKSRIELLNDKYIDAMKENENLKELISQKEKIICQNSKVMSVLLHDIRSPISSIIGISMLAEEGYKELVEKYPCAAENELISTINDLSIYSQSLSTAITLYSKWIDYNRNESKLDAEYYDVHQLIKDIHSELKVKTERKNILLEYIENGESSGSKNEGLSAEETVFTDKNLVYIVINNLVSNSIKFTPEGKRIYISAEPLDDFYFKVAVKDEGRGIPVDIRSKLFSSENITTEGTNGEKGTGKGLKFCRELAEQQGGILDIESTCSNGTSIYFTMPRYSPDLMITKRNMLKH